MNQRSVSWSIVVVLVAGALVVGYLVLPQLLTPHGSAENTREVSPGSMSETNQPPGQNDTTSTDKAAQTADGTAQLDEAATAAGESAPTTPERGSQRTVHRSESISLPLSGSAPTEDVLHTINIEDIRRGCLRQDCIPSVDDPRFISVEEAGTILPTGALGIALEYKGETRFYPFPMLETHELVNDVVAGDPLLVSYCPLCGTGIVFDRTLDGEPIEFGVSGMLWQSNLLMYNRAEDIGERNLWSQVLGEAVVGSRAGEKLDIVPSNIVRFDDWKDGHQNAQILTTGSPRDPYGGDYFGVARNFDPDFDTDDSPLPPTAYVYGVEVNGTFKAYPEARLPVGTITDTVAGESITIAREEDGTVTITDSSGATLPDVEGFWFSWVAAHPETELWSEQ